MPNQESENTEQKMVKCETCNGTGQAVYSCCTGEVIYDDLMMCPDCKEHLGEEDCQDCDGTGEVPEEKTDFATKVPGISTRAEQLWDEMRGH